MATDVDQAYYVWSQEELSDGDEPQEATSSQMVDHGSISFGRFAVETLSWERRSVFTHNRRQEELEKFNGLVAKKKAYFEERYRRIRALKASKQNQRTELTLDYGADGSISSQTGEEDETASLHESPREQEANAAATPSEDIKVGPSFDQEISCKEVLEPMSSILEPSTPTLQTEISLPVESNGKIELHESSNGDLHVEPIKTEPLSLFGQDEKIISEIEENVDRETGRVENVVQKVKTRAVAKAPLKGIKDSEQNKTRTTKKPLYSKPAPNVKATTSAVRNGSILDRAPKQNASQPPNRVVHHGHKMSGKTLGGQIMGNRLIVQQVKNNLSSALVPSNRSLADPQRRMFAPGSFTLAMEKRANSRVSATKLDTMNSNKLAATKIHANNVSNTLDMKKKRATESGMVSRGGSESKREVNNAMKKPLAADSRHTTTRRNETPMLRTQKPRLSSSLNLPARNSTARNLLSTPRVAKMEGKETIEVRQFQGVTGKSFGSSMNGNMKFGTKKPIQAKHHEHFYGGNKRLDNSFLDGGKTRRDAQHWR